VNRRRWLLGILAAILAVAITVVWVEPLVLGPKVACGMLDATTCNETWDLFVAETQSEGRFEWLPVTRVSFGLSSDGCGSVWVERWIFAEIHYYDC
jgi:hypothetical protein